MNRWFSGQRKPLVFTLAFLIFLKQGECQTAYFFVYDSQGPLPNVTVSDSSKRYYLTDKAGKFYCRDFKSEFTISHTGYSTRKFMVKTIGDTFFLEKIFFVEEPVVIRSTFKLSRTSYTDGSLKVNRFYHFKSLCKQRMGIVFDNEHPQEKSLFTKFSFILTNSNEINSKNGVIEFKFFSIVNGKIEELPNRSNIILPLNKLMRKNTLVISEKIFMPDEKMLVTMLFLNTEDANDPIPFEFSGTKRKECSIVLSLPFTYEGLKHLNISNFCQKIRMPDGLTNDFIGFPTQITYTPFINKP